MKRSLSMLVSTAKISALGAGSEILRLWLELYNVGSIHLHIQWPGSGWFGWLNDVLGCTDHTTTTNGYSEEKPSGVVQHKSNGMNLCWYMWWFLERKRKNLAITRSVSFESIRLSIQWLGSDKFSDWLICALGCTERPTSITNGCLEENPSGGVQNKSNGMKFELLFIFVKVSTMQVQNPGYH